MALPTNSCQNDAAKLMPNFAVAPMTKPAAIAALRDAMRSEITPLNMRTMYEKASRMPGGLGWGQQRGRREGFRQAAFKGCLCELPAGCAPASCGVADLAGEVSPAHLRRCRGSAW
jgi:hypothetical protein